MLAGFVNVPPRVSKLRAVSPDPHRRYAVLKIPCKVKLRIDNKLAALVDVTVLAAPRRVLPDAGVAFTEFRRLIEAR